MRYHVHTIRVQLEVSEPASPTHIVRASKDAAEILRAIFQTLDADQEHCVVLALNAKNRMTGYKVVSSGGANRSLVDQKILFRSSLMLGAVAVIVAHNHPSGDPLPSQEDDAMTKAIQASGKILDIPLLDHIVIGSDRHYSYADEGKLSAL